MTRQADDTLNISDGGVLVVDTDRFRAVQDRLRPLSATFSAAADDLVTAKWVAMRAERPIQLDLIIGFLSNLAEAVALTCQRLGHMIEVFELVEAHLAGKGFTERVPLGRPMFAAGSDYPDATRSPADQARALIEEWEQDSSRGFFESTQWTWLLGAPIWAAATGFGVGYPALVKTVGHGTVSGRAPLKPVEHAVNVAPVSLKAPAAPPAGLAEATERFPDSEGAQVRVEKYTMEDGSIQYAVYIAGTDMNPGSPWSNESNLDLYVGQETSASYAAVTQALELAGVTADDPVHMFTHSQGAMIGGHLAASGDFNVVTHASFGSPVEVEAPSTVTNYIVRHTNEPVALLAGGGSAIGSGSANSLTIDRIGEPGADPLNPLATHFLDSYKKTASLIDESSDARLQPMRELFDQLGQATSVEAMDFVATV